jgi:murein DD-endopeptidase MepM/ murein hydrolase activator NlpD
MVVASACALAPATAGAAEVSSGGVIAPGEPKVKDVVCLKGCVGGRTATPGAAVQVRGVSLAYTTRIVFRGPNGPIHARSIYRDSRRVKARVPAKALSSRPYVLSSRGVRSNRSPHRLKVVPRSELPVEVFPIRGSYRFWDGWGAGRGHQGTDVGAACGTPLVSAVDGRVEHRAFHGAAGNYLVIDTKGARTDLMYAHLLKASWLRPGQFVSAGQRIGSVGETGNASGCHLHFELWQGDWYGGGRPVDSEPYLRKLSRQSRAARSKAG